MPRALSPCSVAALALALLAAAPASAAGAAARIKFHVAAGPLDDALVAFAAQSGVQLVYTPGTVKSRTAPALVGRFTIDAGLARLLAGTGVSIERPRPGVLVLRASPPERRDPAPVAPGGAERPVPVITHEAGQTPDPSSRVSEVKPSAIVSELVVTGSQIHGAPVGPSHVEAISRDDLDHSGEATVADLLTVLPQNFAGTAQPSTFLIGSDGLGNNSTVAQGVNLRGLGAPATLVLVDGHRLAGVGLNGDFADLSSIPTAAVDRVELLLDGASAIYGSDAVGGVVNVITRRNFIGDETRARFQISATATALLDPEVAFGIGSDLANLNGGILNAVLGKMLGTNLSLSVMDYQSLASSQVDLFTFSNDLATRLNLTGVTYNQLAQTQVAAPTLLAALNDSSQGGAGVSNILTTLASSAPSTTMAVGQLVSFGEYGSLATNSAVPITAKASVMDMVSAIAELANGSNQVQAPLNVSIPPVASATLSLTVGERAVGSGFFAIGSTGVSVHTAQTRLLLSLQIAQIGSTSLINLPIYMELAPATATLSAATCPADITQATATLAVTPGVVNAWIGNVTSAAMTNFSSEPTPGAAPLVTIPLVGGVSGRANANISNPTPFSVMFTYSDYLDHVRKSVATTDYLSPLLYNLLANLQLTVTVAGVSISAPAAVTTSLGTTLAGAVSPIDTIISQVLEGLGVTVGNAYTWLGGIKCGPARLVL